MRIIPGDLCASANVADLELALRAEHATRSELELRAEALAVSVEIAELHRAEGEQVPEHLLREVTEYRGIQRRLSAPNRREQHRRNRRQHGQATRAVVRLVQSTSPSASVEAGEVDAA